jgi:hypothetical protein
VTICISTAMFAIAAALHKRGDRADSP